ncbi:hypothetical protein ACOMHN_028930 [Nucella lapillus]
MSGSVFSELCGKKLLSLLQNLTRLRLKKCEVFRKMRAVLLLSEVELRCGTSGHVGNVSPESVVVIRYFSCSYHHFRVTVHGLMSDVKSVLTFLHKLESPQSVAII